MDFKEEIEKMNNKPFTPSEEFAAIKKYLRKEMALTDAVIGGSEGCPGYGGRKLEDFDQEDLICIVHILYKKKRRLERILRNMGNDLRIKQNN